MWQPAEDGEVPDWTSAQPMVEKVSADWREQRSGLQWEEYQTGQKASRLEPEGYRMGLVVGPGLAGCGRLDEVTRDRSGYHVGEGGGWRLAWVEKFVPEV